MPPRTVEETPRPAQSTTAGRHWALTKGAALAREGEKVGRLTRWRTVQGECAPRCARPGEGAFPVFWPFRGVRACPPPTRRRRKLVVNKFGSPNRNRTLNLPVNSQGRKRPSTANLKLTIVYAEEAGDGVVEIGRADLTIAGGPPGFGRDFPKRAPRCARRERALSPCIGHFKEGGLARRQPEGGEDS
jgi:hypothetical protein